MAINSNISFRNHLFGSVEDFVASTAMQPFVTARTVAHLVVGLGNYTEEGKSLRPEIYLTTNIGSLLKFLPGSTSILIGNCPISEEAPTIALKHCAPLASDGWCIFVNSDGNIVTYGVFRDALSPLAVPLDEALLKSGSGDTKVLRVHHLHLTVLMFRTIMVIAIQFSFPSVQKRTRAQDNTLTTLQ
jgi:hypothetical protein